MRNATILLLAILVCVTGRTQNLPCFSETRDLQLGSLMPYTKVKVGSAEGYFLIDFGTTGSTIDTNGFINSKPVRVAGTTNRFDNFDFFGSRGRVTLSIQNHSSIQGIGSIKQAGILGTDFLSLNSFLLDYTNMKISRSSLAGSCDDSTLIKEGFRAASTAGYFSNELSKLNNTCTSNIPTIPVKVGNATAVAQIDPGYDDRFQRHSLNINRAFFDAIRESGIQLIPNPGANLTLSTCVGGVSEAVTAYTLPASTVFSVTGIDGNAIIVHADVNIFLKETPAQAKSCGGIGTWSIPAAQMGASFLLDTKKVIFDPFKQKVWFYTR